MGEVQAGSIDTERRVDSLKQDALRLESTLASAFEVEARLRRELVEKDNRYRVVERNADSLEKQVPSFLLS